MDTETPNISQNQSALEPAIMDDSLFQSQTQTQQEAAQLTNTPMYQIIVLSFVEIPFV